MGFASWGTISVGLLVVLATAFCSAQTDPRDVAAMNGLFTSLGSPPLLGWLPVGGDPCWEEWQGVSCVFSNITELRLSGMNLGGFLDESIGDFESIIVMDLSNNHIGGSIPSNLPLTIRNFSLSGNKFNGSIPATLSTLSQLVELSLSNNNLSEGIPDSFQQIKGLINLDLSGNNLSGQLPPSFGSLSSLNTLHLQNNKLSGMLDVLQDLPLLDLNVENNLFSGPIPAKLMNIPNFRKDGNPFNTTIIPSPPVAALPPFVAGAPSSEPGYGGWANGPSASKSPLPARSFWTTKRLVWSSVLGVLVLVLLAVCLLVWRCCKVRQVKKHDLWQGTDASKAPRKPNHSNQSSFQLNYQTDKVPEEDVMKPADVHGADRGRMVIDPKKQEEHVIDVVRLPPSSRYRKDHEAVIVNQTLPALVNRGGDTSVSQNSLCSMRVFTIASLQEYTNSFSEENFVGAGILGNCYRAELPDGTLFAIKKLDSKASSLQSDDEFLELVTCISKLKHPNVVELVGYCNEHGQRLLVYEYCRNGALYDALHLDDEIHRKLSWNARVRVALGAARALQYLHEVCQPPIIHRNFKSANVLLGEKLEVHVSDCGLAPLLSSNSASQLSERLKSYGYGAPEFESGSYTCQSDIYSLGIVMLELLTGRKPIDRSRPRGEQSLVAWAIPQLHDINALSRMVDPSLNGAYPVKSLSRFADIISRCVQWEPGFRPPASEIVQDLLHMI